MKLMKHITSFLLALASFIASLSHAQVLPKPVFSTAPATVRLVVKNPNGQLYNSIGLFYNTFASIDYSYFTLVSQNGGTQVYEAKADVDMTVLAKMHYSRSRKHEESVPADIMLVPGKTTTVEYDGKTGKLKFKGPFAKLNEEITKYTEDEAKYSYIRIFNYNPNVATDTIDRHTPEDMHRICNFNFQEAEREMAADKKISAEFKEWWKCYMVNEFNYAMQTYTYKYTKAMPDWGPQTNGKPIEAYYTLEHIADPAFGNAIFYQRKNSYTTRLFDLYEKFSGKKLQMSEEVGRLRKAYDADWHIRSSNNFFLKQKLDLICNELPEYKPVLQKIVKDLHEHMETEEGKPVVGNFCTLDRTLEGEDIMKELLAKYRNGKPTIVGIYDYGPYSSASILQNELGNEVNFVYLTGGKYSNEDAFFSNLKNSRGDFYYLMNYQIEYLHKRYRKIKGLSRVIVIAFDADGNMIMNPEEFNQFTWVKIIKETLFK